MNKKVLKTVFALCAVFAMTSVNLLNSSGPKPDAVKTASVIAGDIPILIPIPPPPPPPNEDNFWEIKPNFGIEELTS